MKWLEERRELRRMVEARLKVIERVVSKNQLEAQARDRLAELNRVAGTNMYPACLKFYELVSKLIHLDFDYNVLRVNMHPLHLPVARRAELEQRHEEACQLASAATELNSEFEKLFLVLDCLIGVNALSPDDSIGTRAHSVGAYVVRLLPYSDDANHILQACTDLSERQQFMICISTDDVARFIFENEEALDVIVDDVEVLCNQLVELT